MSDISRTAILTRLRQQKLPACSLPEVVEGRWIRYDDVVSQLGRTIVSVGGSFSVLPDLSAVHHELSALPQFNSAKRILSLVEGIENQFDLESINDPRTLEDLDMLIAPGDLAVAENGAVWVTDEYVKQRVVYFINQHLVLLVHRSDVVNNMHEAYSRIKFRKPGFGCFISGPSKTADIEQSLVIGAHGCRSMRLIIVG